MKKISVVVPCYNESAGISFFFNAILELVSSMAHYDFEVVFVNDGSVDDTLSIVGEICLNYSWVKAINLTRNFGKEAALTASLDYVDGDAVVFMDADLQHPPSLVRDFVRYWELGEKVVVGRRKTRETDAKLYRILAEGFYSIHNKISDVRLPENVGDFRLIDKRVADQLRSLRESRRFMKGLFAWVGYEPVYIEYSVPPRVYGSSSFNKWKSWNFALEGITSFSTAPLRVWSYIGAAVLCLGLSYAALIISQAVLHGVSTPGYVTLLTAVVVFGGVQLIGIGVLGEYIGRIYMEVKGRPPYLVDKVLGEKVKNLEN